MARKIGKLSAVAVRAASKPGIYGDGAGLWLTVGPTGAKSWLFRFMLAGKAREMGLGPVHTIGLAEAREKALACRKMLLDGLDPLAARQAARAAQAAGEALELAGRVTFRDAAERFIAANRAGWKNAKHAAQWNATLESYAFPLIGDLAVAAVGTGHVTRILEPIWREKPETASRVRGRIEAVLDSAKVHGWRDGENPARWKGHLESILPARGKVASVEHHAALPWRDIAAFVADLEKQDGTAALALRFAILTAARTGEVIGATWQEITLDGPDGAVWTIPAGRMKAGREHRVPLSDAARAVLTEAAKARTDQAAGAFVFRGQRAGRGLSNMAMLVLLRRMERGDLTAHGFRSTFRDWAGEATHNAREIVETALAHAVGTAVEQAYRRGDMLAKRRRLMDDWAAFCGRTEPAGDNVVVLPAAAA